MICPNCQSGDVVVRASRLVHGVRQRGRGCRACNARWFTREMMVDGTLDVPKPEPEWWSRARQMRRQGLTHRAIADQLGVSRFTVGRALRPVLRRRDHERTKTYRSGEEGRLMMRTKKAAEREARA